MQNVTDSLIGVLLLVEALRPYASFPPPAATAPATWMRRRGNSMPAQLPRGSTEQCCLERTQHTRAMSRLRSVWPWLPARSAEQPLFGGARPMPASMPGKKGSGFDAGAYLLAASQGDTGGAVKGKDESVKPIKEGMVRR